MGKIGDCFDRFLIRIREMFESIYIIYQLLPNFLDLSRLGFRCDSSSFFTFISPVAGHSAHYRSKNTSMESLIEHFKGYSEGIKVGSGMAYRSVEAPKGEFGVTLVSDGSNQPFRCKVRTPAYHHLQIMSKMIQGHLFADAITILGSQDIVFGEVDR